MNRTVERAIEILDLISRSDRGVTLAEVARATGMPKTSAYDILRALEEKYMIYRRDDQAHSYSIGFRAFAIGHNYSRSSHLLTNANAEIRKLAEKLGKTVLLCKDYDDKILYVAKYEPRDAVILTPSVGETVGMDNSAAGKVFAAHLRGCGDGGLLGPGEAETIRRAGYAACRQESGAPVYTVAAPVFNFENFLSGVVTVVALEHQRGDPSAEAAEVSGCAREISRNLGHRAVNGDVPPESDE